MFFGNTTCFSRIAAAIVLDAARIAYLAIFCSCIHPYVLLHNAITWCSIAMLTFQGCWLSCQAIRIGLYPKCLERATTLLSLVRFISFGFLPAVHNFPVYENTVRIASIIIEDLNFRCHLVVCVQVEYIKMGIIQTWLSKGQ